MAQSYGEYDTLISHKRHKIIKLTLPRSKITCLKIFTFTCKESKKNQLYRDHFQKVREWMKLRYSGKSLLRTMDKIDLNVGRPDKSSSNQITHLKISTDYLNFPNLEIYYEKVQQNKEGEGMSQDIHNYIYYIQEFFELILRGGSIPNFFYTPKNIFFNRPPPLDTTEIGRFSVNFLSTVGLDMLFLGENIIKEDLEQIFPLLPYKLEALMNPLSEPNLIELNRIIKMKALAWNLLAFIIRYVPNILIREILESTVKIERVFQLLRSGFDKVIKQLLEISKDEIASAAATTGINFNKLFHDILIEDCRKITWSDIYTQLFLQNKHAKERFQNYSKYQQKRIDSPTESLENIPHFKISQQILNSLWNQESEEIRKFYLDRSIVPSSTVYFLIRTNINFRHMMTHLNILELLDETQSFCADNFKVHLTFIEASIAGIEGISANFIMPYGQQKIPEIIRTTEEGQLFVRMNDPSQVIEGLSVTNRTTQNSIVISHYTVDMIADLTRKCWNFD